MIRHIVAWTFKEYVGGASAMENAMELKKQLDRKLVIRKDREGSHISLNIL